MARFIVLAIVFCGLQGGFWYHTRDRVPDMSIVPDVPGRETVEALSLGDEQFFFRLLSLQLQNAGDTFGRFTALNKYDFNKLYHWFRLLDALDATSNYVPSMATYYFSQTQNRPDVKYVVDYLMEHTEGRTEEKWWWVVQAVYLANHKLENKDLALRIAQRLVGDYDIPVWARQMPAFIHEQRGEMQEAALIIDAILKDDRELTKYELNFIQYFADERLKRLGELQAQLEKRRSALQENEKGDAPKDEPAAPLAE